MDIHSLKLDWLNLLFGITNKLQTIHHQSFGNIIVNYQLISNAKLPTQYGEFVIHVFENEHQQEHVLLSKGLPDNHNIPLVRIHSECLTGDAFGSLKCDCGAQLKTAMQMITQYGCGAILYLRQEGRGIGLANKIRAYALQDQGHDTLQANLLLGLPADARTYDMCQTMLHSLGIQKLKLLTNNPNKIHELTQLGFEIVERIPLLVGMNADNLNYLQTKKHKMGHLID